MRRDPDALELGRFPLFLRLNKLAPVVLGLALAAASAAAACSDESQEPSAGEWFERGRQAEAIQDWAAAATAFAKAIAADPTRAEFRLHHAVAVHRTGEIESAVALLEALVRAEPLLVDAATQLARWYVDAGRGKDAVAVLAPHAEKAGLHDVQQLLGQAWLLLGQPAEARSCIARCLTVQPASGIDHYLMGECHRLDGRPALASQSYLKALEFGYETGALHARLAETLHARGRDVVDPRIVKATSDLAGTLYGESFLLEPLAEAPAIYRACGVGSALYHVHRAIALEAEVPGLALLLGDVSLAAQRYDEARRAYIRALADADPGLSPARRAEVEHGLARACLGVGDTQSYVDHAEAAAAADAAKYGPWLFTVYHTAANRWAAEGDRARCIDALERAARARADDAPTRFRLGELLWEAGRREDAVRQWRITLELDPRHPARDRMMEAIREVGKRSG